MKRFKFTSVDLYNHFFSTKEIEAEDVIGACVEFYEDPDLRKTFEDQLKKNNHQWDGLATNTDEGTWRISGEETLILIEEIQ